MTTRDARRVSLPGLAAMKRRRRAHRHGDRPTTRRAHGWPKRRASTSCSSATRAAMVVFGHESTLPVTLDEMLILTRAVTRVARRPLVVGDLPFGSYQVSDDEAVASAVRLVKEGGADVVKLEGIGRHLSRVRAIIEAGIPVMGHIGLTPQAATMLGGFRTQGRTAAAGAGALRHGARPAVGRLLRDRARSHAGGRRLRDHARACRFRPSASAPGPAAMARCSSGTICWACRSRRFRAS